ncbi:MAG TPA: lipopolysaccharide kinase InaA family protein, partial [Gemmataceae bacterium]|nr:lipopolysaccharide kinase InaA family protein [Gemmataceae bacterium]
CFLKREHHIPWKDRWRSFRAGFGLVSLSQREAGMIDIVKQAGIAAPDWLAVGEDGYGRAFLLLKAMDSAVDLRQYLRRGSEEEHCELARLLGEIVAGMHDKGIEHPDLYAKHVFVDPQTMRFALIDWQRSRKPRRLSFPECCRDLAALNGSLADELAGDQVRREFLRLYCQRRGHEAGSLEDFCQEIQARTARLLHRASIREQRLPTLYESQPLFWLDGEALCVTPRGQELWHADALLALGYPERRRPGSESVSLTLPDGNVGELTRRRSLRLFGRCRDWLRQKRWTSPEVRQAGHLLRRERLGERGPMLLAFGQRPREFGVVESFVLTQKELNHQSRARSVAE